MDYGNNREPKFLPDFDVKYLIDRWGSLDTENLYLSYFNKISSNYTFGELEMEKFHREFQQQFQKNILGWHYKKFNLREDFMSDYTYVLEKEIIVNKDNSEVIVYFSEENCALLKEILTFAESCRKRKDNKAYINLIIQRPHGLDNKKIDFTKPDLQLSKMYNDDFQDFHHKILSNLKEKDQSGLHLLYGPPGTGKSTYIRYLCGLVEKEIIFLPGQMAQNLDNIAMTRYLMNNTNCVLVIEDAEELISTQNGQRNSNLAMILNITDGILGESLGIQIIATFNTDVKNIDPALKRKGRLKSAYEFKALAAEKAAVLLREQDPEFSATGEMTLAEIYNFTEEEQYKEKGRRAVGF